MHVSGQTATYRNSVTANMNLIGDLYSVSNTCNRCFGNVFDAQKLYT